MAHTPGPWVVGWGWDVDEWCAGVGLGIVAVTQGGICDMMRRKDGAHRANARLIAAAPDLLAACEAIAADLNKYGRVRPPAMELLIDAVAKARGREEG